MSVFKQAFPILRYVGGFRCRLTPSIMPCRILSLEALSKEELQVAESVLARLTRTTQPSEEVPAASTEVLPTSTEWGPNSRRSGVIAIKLGMTQLWTKDGMSVPVTVLQVCRIRRIPS